MDEEYHFKLIYYKKFLKSEKEMSNKAESLKKK